MCHCHVFQGKAVTSRWAVAFGFGAFTVMFNGFSAIKYNGCVTAFCWTKLLFVFVRNEHDIGLKCCTIKRKLTHKTHIVGIFSWFEIVSNVGELMEWRGVVNRVAENDSVSLSYCHFPSASVLLDKKNSISKWYPRSMAGMSRGPVINGLILQS